MLNSRASLILSALAVAVLAWGCTDESEPAATSDAEAASPSQAATEPAKPAARPSETKRPTQAKQPSPSGTDLDSRLPENHAFKDVLAIEDVYERVGALARLLPTLGPESVPTVKALLNGLNDDTQRFGVAEASLLVAFWSQHDAKESARWVLSTSPLAYRGGLLIPAVEVWATEDPHGAAKAVVEHIDYGGMSPGQPMQRALVRGWFDSGKPGLEEFIQGLGVSFRRQRMLHALLDRIADRDGVEAAARWAEGLPDDDAKFKLSAHRQAAKVIARRDPAVASAWCEKVCDGPYGSNVRFMIAQHWAWRDGEGVMRWIAEMPDGKERDQTVKAAFRGWWPYDREGFLRFATDLKQKENGVPAWFRPAIELFASGLVRWGRPEEAMKWVAEIEDDEVRRRSMTNVAIIWRQQDQAAADAWLETSPLTEEQREMVRNPVTGTPAIDFPNPDALP